MVKFILSKNKVKEQYNKVKEVTDIVSYSSKTNPLITPILEEKTNCYFSIHLKNELKNVKDKKRVIFLGQGWNEKEIEDLLNKGITFFAVDNEPDLDLLLKTVNKNQTKIKLLLRMKLKEYSLRTERYFVFGMSSEIINRRISELKENKNVESIGIHFHRKTQNMSEWNYEFELEQSLNEKTFEKLNFINIGGGLPSEYANTNVDVINSILDRVKELRSWLNQKNIQMIIEPGRFIAAPSCKLETNIKRIYENNIIIDASVYNSDMDALIVPVKLKIESELQRGEGEAYVIKGVTPCSMDLFRYRVYLRKPKVGDKLIFLNAGSYNFTSEFCDLEKIKTVIVE